MNAISLTRQIGRCVYRERTARKLTQAQLAKAAGVSDRLVRDLELGKATGISIEKLTAILNQVDVELCVQGVQSNKSNEAALKNYSEALWSVVAPWMGEEANE